MSFHRGDVEAFLASPLAAFKPWVYEGRSPQRDFLRAAATHRTRIIRAGNQAQPLDEPVLTPQGWRPIGALSVDDAVLSGNGDACCVTKVWDRASDVEPQKIYRVTFDDGASTSCTGDHRWTFGDPEAPRASPSKRSRLGLAPTPTYTIDDFLSGDLGVSLGPDALFAQRWPAHRASTGRAVRTLRKIEVKVSEEPVRCITVDHPSGTYVTRDGIVTHNSGKSVITVYDNLCALLGWHPHTRLQPPIHAWHSALDWEFGVGQVLWPKYRALLPWNRVRSVLWFRKQKDVEMPATIVFDNGSRLDFKSAEAGRTKYQGAPLHRVILDEEHPHDIGEECRMRLLKHGGEFVLALTPVRRERWILDVEKEGETHVTRMSTFDAARAGVLNEAAVTSIAAALPDRQRAVRMEGDFAQLEGLVYPSFHRSVHVLRPKNGSLFRASGESTRTPWPLPVEWPRYAAMDFGFSVATAVVVFALDPHRDALIVERVYHSPGIRGSQWGRILQRELPMLDAPIVCDHDAGERAEIEHAGLPTLAADKANQQMGLEIVERWLEPRHDLDGRPRLEIVVEDEPARTPETGRCDGLVLVEEFESYRYVERPRATGGRTAADPKDVPIKRDDHACFAGETMVWFLGGARARIDLLAEVGGINVAAFDGERFVSARARAEITGERDLVEVAFEGGVVKCTEDHPFLTPRGWIPAGALTCADTLIQCVIYERSDDHRRYAPGFPRTDVREVRTLLPGDDTPAHAAARGRLGGGARDALLTEDARAPQGRGPHEQRTRESGVDPGSETPFGPHDAGASKSGSGEDRRVRGPGGAGVAPLEGGSGMALQEREGSVARAAVYDALVRGLRHRVQDSGSEGNEVLRSELQDACVERTPRFGAARLARVAGVRRAGRESVYNLYVTGLHNFLANGVVVSNCDACRYGVVWIEKMRGGSGEPLVAGAGGVAPRADRYPGPSAFGFQ